MTWFIPPILVGLLILFCAAMGLVFDCPALLPAPFPYLGILFIVIGGGLLVSGAAQFKKVQTNIHTFKDPNQLVTSGPFRFTRNPMYLGFLCVLIGVALMFNTLVGLIVIPVFFLAAQFWYIPFEEARAREGFGEAYEAYRRQVRRWI